MIPNELEKSQLAAMLVDTMPNDLSEVCPHCKETLYNKPRNCTECGVSLLDWVNKGGHKVLCCNGTGHE